MNLKRHDPQKAMEYFQRALAEAPPDFALLYQDIADLYASAGDQRATEYYQKALMLDPRLVQSHVTLAGSAVMRRDFESAERHLQAVVRLDPDWSGGWALLGTAYDSAGSAAQAASAYRMALRVAPNDSGAYYALRRVQQKG